MPTESVGDLAMLVGDMPEETRGSVIEKLFEISLGVGELIEVLPLDPQIEHECIGLSIPREMRDSLNWSALLADPDVVIAQVDLRWRLDVVAAMETAPVG